MYGKHNQPCNSKLVHNAYGIQIETLYGYFFTSPKHHLKFTKFVKIIEIESLKVFRNVKTRCTNMLQPLKSVGKKYKTWIVKMTINYSSLESAKANLLNLCDIDTILACHVFCPCWKLLMPWWVCVGQRCVCLWLHCCYQNLPPKFVQKVWRFKHLLQSYKFSRVYWCDYKHIL